MLAGSVFKVTLYLKCAPSGNKKLQRMRNTWSDTKNTI